MISPLNNIVTKVVQLQGDEAWGEGGGSDKYNGTLSGENFFKTVSKTCISSGHFKRYFWKFKKYLNVQWDTIRSEHCGDNASYKAFPVIL